MIGEAVIQAILAAARPEAAKAFYTEVLGLKLLGEDQFALLFAGKIGFLRIAKAPAVAPATQAQVAFDIPDIEAAVAALAAKGVAMERYPFLTPPQDAKGVWTAPDGARVAWFRDPDLNLLSLLQRPA